MAKFNIEVDLEWLGEGGDLDQIIKDEIIASITSKVSAKAIGEAQEKIEARIEEDVTQAVGTKLNLLLEDFFTKPRTITDKWGNVTSTDISVTELLEESCDKFIDGYVDKNGNPCHSNSYGDKKRRIDYIIEKHIDFKLQQSISNAAAEVKKGLQKYLDETLKAQIGENVAQVIGLDKIKAKISCN